MTWPFPYILYALISLLNIINSQLIIINQYQRYLINYSSIFDKFYLDKTILCYQNIKFQEFCCITLKLFLIILFILSYTSLINLLGSQSMSNISMINPEAIRKHPSNTSPSKIAHQFSKTKRFIADNPYCPIAFYTYDSQLSNRKAGFGYGDKVDFTRSSVISPPSTLYKHQSVFEEGRVKNKGKTFGLSRDLSPDNSYLVPQIQKIPGPGKYENQVRTRMTISYTTRPRTVDAIANNLTYKKSPGPGVYQQIDLEPKNGRFKFSKFADTKFAKITNMANRFPDPKDTPGPLSYKEGDGISNKGKYILSNHKGRGTRVFDKTTRTHFTDDFSNNKRMNPGPGKYEKISQFGVYGDAKYYKTLGSSKPA